MFCVRLLIAVVSLASLLANIASSLTITIEDRHATITAAPFDQLNILFFPRGLIRRACPSGYVSHLSGCCLATALKDCGNGVTVCTAQCPASSTTAAGSCPSGYVTHLSGCCLATELKDCGNGVTVCTAQCPASSTTTAAGSCPSGYVTHLSGCCLSSALRDCGNGITVCTPQCPAPSTTTAAGGCQSGYVSYFNGCCLSQSLLNCDGATLCSGSCSITLTAPAAVASPTTATAAIASPTISQPTSPQTTSSTTTTTNLPNTASLLSDLQSGVPTTAQADPAAACFLNTSYTAFYSTPAWYTALPVSAQSYFSSLNAGNVTACTASPLPGTQNSGLSPGAEGGIAVGAIAGAALVGLLLWFLIAKCMASSSSETAASGWNGVVGSAPPPAGWNGVVGSHPGGWDGIVGSPPPAHYGQTPFIPILGAAVPRRRSEEQPQPQTQQRGGGSVSNVSPVPSPLPLEREGAPSSTAAPYEVEVNHATWGSEIDGAPRNPPQEVEAWRGSEIPGNPRYELG